MKHLASNLIMIALAAFTLFFAVVSPPWTDASASKIEDLTTVSAHASLSAQRNNGSYTALRPYIEEHGGKVIYNSENATIDILVDEGSFSLLLEENMIRQNGRELPGRFYIVNGVAYMEMAWIEALSAKS